MMLFWSVFMCVPVFGRISMTPTWCWHLRFHGKSANFLCSGKVFLLVFSHLRHVYQFKFIVSNSLGRTNARGLRRHDIDHLQTSESGAVAGTCRANLKTQSIRVRKETANLCRMCISCAHVTDVALTSFNNINQQSQRSNARLKSPASEAFASASRSSPRSNFTTCFCRSIFSASASAVDSIRHDNGQPRLNSTRAKGT